MHSTDPTQNSQTSILISNVNKIQSKEIHLEKHAVNVIILAHWQNMFFDMGSCYDIVKFTRLTYSACLHQFEDISARKKLAGLPEYPEGMGGKQCR